MNPRQGGMRGVVIAVALFVAAVLCGASAVGFVGGWGMGKASVELVASIGSTDSTAGPATSIKPGKVPANLVVLYEKAAKEHGCSVVTPLLLAAQGKHESSFNPNAVSPVGAIGIAQFLPSTWRAYGFDGDGDGRKDIRNPADAIPAQAIYDCAIAKQVARIPGDAESLMLAAYLYGPYAVIRRGGIPDGARNYIETIQGFEKELGAPVPSGTGPSSVPAGVLGKMIEYAKAQQGEPYIWAGSGPRGFDCSGLIVAASRAAGGPALPHNAGAQYERLRHISASEAMPGDLVFFNWGEFRAGEPGHVGIYLGNGMMVNAASSRRPLARQITTEPIKGFSTNRTEFARIDLG